MSKTFSHRVRRIFKSMKVSVCGCHRNENVLVAMDMEYKPYNRPLSNIYIEEEADDRSADEKLRSLSHKGHHSSKTNSNTYCGAQNGQSSSPGGTFVTSARSEAPDVPPPPIPHVTTNQIQQNQSHDQIHHEPTNQNRSNRSSVIILETCESEIPPPIFPKPQITQMAERRLQRQNRKSGSHDENVALKKRSRSEGPHGRRKLRNSMHETSNKVSSNKLASNGRHSMYTGHLSDDDNVVMNSGSESPDSDIVDQRWTKNPLMSRKARKIDKISKTDKRRSAHNVENGKGIEQSGPNSYQVSQSRDFFIPRKSDNFQSQSNKSKFLRMEENRKKRIDMAVTSDEECSPQLRISRLRQRAMMSSQLGDNQRFEDSINIVPVRDESSFKAYQEFQNGLSQVDKSGRNRVSQYDENTCRLSKYDENYNVNGNFYQEYTKQQGVKHNKLPNVLPEFLPENRATANMTSRNSQRVQNVDHLTTNVPVHIKTQPKQEKQTRQRGVKMSSESPKLRSFNEVKANQPTQLKKADQRIELNLRSPNSSSDSLDDLIESNIQYLESEIESGKLKRQSGNYSQEKTVQKQVIGEPYQTSQKQEEFRSRLQDPRTFVSNKLMSTVTKVEPKLVQKSTVFPQPGISYSSQYQNYHQTSSSMMEHRNVPPSGSATYSPYMQRKNHDVNEDISKSDSHLNALNANFNPMPKPFQPSKSYAPYPVLNKETGNIMYVQPADSIEDQMQLSENGIGPVVDSGMFSDVEYNIEVSERIKKWEKKLTPGELEERHKVLNTIKEYESFSDSNQKDSVPDTPVEVRRELWQLVSPTSNSGVGKLSVNLTRSTSSMSDSNMQDPSSYQLFEPKVVSSETNLHRIFRVVNEPKRRQVMKTIKVKPSAESNDTLIQNRSRRKPQEVTSQSLSNVTLSESEIGSNMQQSWPPMVVDSDSGIRKSWRMSRYEDEINELKELVSDNFRDIRKRFDSDMSETDTKRASPVFIEPQVQVPVAVNVPVTSQLSSGTSKLTLNIQPVTPTNQRSPVTIRRKLSDQRKEPTPPASPAVPVTPKNERKVPIFRNVPIETKSFSTAIESPMKKTRAISDVKQAPAADGKLPPDVWSPNMESRKGLVSIERVKARTLQTIPFSEDPVWKEIEGLATFDKPDEISKEVNFDEIDELLKLATGGVDNLKARSKPNSEFDNQMKRLTTSDNTTAPDTVRQDILMTQSFTPTTHMQVPKEKHRALSDSTYPPSHSNKHVFNPPTIQPLKLNTKPSKKSSTSALDEVLEDIRATLQKKPLSPKLMKNLDTSDTNSSTNLSLQSPLTKSSKSFIFPKHIKRAKTERMQENPEVVKSAAATPGYDNTSESWKPAQNEIPPQALQQLVNTTYIDPEFTQFPYIINGNYHLDPKLLSEKLKSTGLANDSSDEILSKRRNVFDLPANHQALNIENSQPANQVKRKETANQSKPITHELDRSVDDLRSLAQEVEYKLSQIKSRIVSADEDRLDSILLALRKFAPMTEEKFFNVKFTPNYESEKARRSKLEDALNELDKMYESLDLDDQSLLDRASRREDTIEYENRHGIKSSVQNKSGPRVPDKTFSVERKKSESDGSKILRRSQIDEIERQTQNEFEDITKSFQVLLDEVTKQCRTVAQRSSLYSPSDSNLFSPAGLVQQYSSQRPPDEIRHEPPRQRLKVETQTQRAVQDSYNTAIKELESVATGTNIPTGVKPVQTVMYLNLDKSKPELQKLNEKQKGADLVSPTTNLNIQIKSKAVVSNKNDSNTSASDSRPFVSMATEFFKPSVGKPVTKDASSGATRTENTSSVSLQVELNEETPQARGSGRFRKRGNVEYRKSMPAITRNVETQTVETQTDSPPTVSEMKEKFEQYRKASLQEMSSDSSPDFKMGRHEVDKASIGVGNDDISSSDDEDEVMRKSKMRRSLSCPDIVALLEEFNRKEKEKEKKLAKVDKTNTKNGTKSATPKSVKQRHENKLRFRSLHQDEVKVNQTEISTSITSDDGFESPKNKPPVYPVWKYPGQVESQKTENVKKSEQRKQSFGIDRDFTKTASDTEQDKVFLRTTDQGCTGVDERVIRRRSRSFGGEQQDPDERPKSFHELVATFEQNPQRREKIRTSGLRKCASEDSMFTDFLLQKIYHSETNLYRDEKGQRLSGSGLKLALEMKLKD